MKSTYSSQSNASRRFIFHLIRHVDNGLLASAELVAYPLRKKTFRRDSQAFNLKIPTPKRSGGECYFNKRKTMAKKKAAVPAAAPAAATAAASTETLRKGCDAGFLHHTLEHAIVAALSENCHEHPFTPDFFLLNFVHDRFHDLPFSAHDFQGALECLKEQGMLESNPKEDLEFCLTETGLRAQEADTEKELG